MSKSIWFEIEINDDGTFSVSKDYSLQDSKATLGEVAAYVVDSLLYEVNNE